jgi:4-oxalocrotonate tautomerase
MAVANVPANHRSQVITRHDPNESIYPEQGHLGIDYYQFITDEIHA